MHIAIDDTYGPKVETESEFVSGRRRTHVAVVFDDHEVGYIRQQIRACLDEIVHSMGVTADEFHFVDVYNRNSPWDQLPGQANLGLFEFFANIYSQYRWPVIIQTIDDLTLKDHGIQELRGSVDGLHLEKPEDLSLLFLLFKIKRNRKISNEEISLIVDEGKKKAGSVISPKIFQNWQSRVSGVYASSKEEPLLQLADFLAFCINRCTHLAMKKNRTEVDNWFLELVGSMNINSEDIKKGKMSEGFTVKDFDDWHREDRAGKGL